jgi:hypothetical protein
MRKTSDPISPLNRLLEWMVALLLILLSSTSTRGQKRLVGHPS